MEDRYEIKEKIGQGGLGAVYRGNDIRMNREVAIKRIAGSTQDSSLSEEATRQLVQEAGSLASLQHPNIVTIYDVGTDEDGPFVVMELLTGETLEEIVERGSLTWQDFRQLALQALEGLIAAQELHIVHRDLKPGNIMLTWLPSGKFQVKIVDFGLAKLSSKPSLQTIDQSDGVFGSIYFMAPEQFERVPIDLKVDLYAIGCVFYHALTGTYPYDGDTAVEVMAAHLQHHVTPIQEIREGIPLWACDWIMWHINRLPADRPESAREALQYFVENDAQPSPTLSTGAPASAPEQPRRPRLLIPGSAPVPEVLNEPTPTQPLKTATTPRPLTPPEGYKPSVHTTSQVLHTAPVQVAPEEQPGGDLAPPAKPISPRGPDPAAPSVRSEAAAAPVLARSTSAQSTAAPLLKAGTPAAGGTTPTRGATNTAATRQAGIPPGPTGKKGLPTGVKTAIATVLGLLAVFVGFLLLKRSGDNREARSFNEMVQYAAKGDATELPVDKLKLEILLRNATSVASTKDRYVIYKALYLAKATDGTDVDARIAEFATTQPMVPDVRVVLIRDVLRKRANPAIIGTLLDFARSTEETPAAIAAIEATRFMATEEHFSEFIEIIQITDNDMIRKAAEENAARIIEESDSPGQLGAVLLAAHDAALNEAIRHSMLRLLGRVGGEDALALVGKNLDSPTTSDKIAAIIALGSWAHDAGFKTLTDYIASGPDLQLRARAYDSALNYASNATENLQEIWTLLAAESRTQDEQLKLVRGLANSPPEPWNYALLQNIIDNSEVDPAVDLAERAIVRLRDIEKTKVSSPSENPSDETPEEEQ